MEDLANHALRTLFLGQHVYFFAEDKPKSSTHVAAAGTNAKSPLNEVSQTENTLEVAPLESNTIIPATPVALPKKSLELLLVSDQPFEVVQDFLTKILAAVSVKLTEEMFIYTANNQADVSNYTCQNLIVFGDAVQVGELPRLVNYNPVQGKTMQLMYAHGLTAIESDKTLKMHLWNALKVMYRIS
jgi:DNA polymerase III psi subunit